jgi:RNA polymerase sigma-70 factor (ECF subfamily)
MATLGHVVACPPLSVAASKRLAAAWIKVHAEGMGRDSRREPMSRRQERAAVSAAQRGSDEAIERLFRSHWPRAYRVALTIARDPAAAEDIAQEAFLAAIRRLDRFDRRRPFGPWLHRIAVNRAIDWSRARAVRHEVAATDALLDAAVAAPVPVEPLERGGEIAAAPAGHSAEHRAVVILRYLLDYTPGEIGKMLDLPRGTINSRLRRALDRLSGSIGDRR